MDQKCALITGITGQDGSFLAELLLSKGYKVYGMVRRSSIIKKTRLEHIYIDPHFSGASFFLEYGDMSDGSSIRKLISKVKPDEIYNLAAQSHVRISFEQPEYTTDVDGMGVIRLLEAVKDYQESVGKKVRFYQASSSEMFGSAPPPQDESTIFQPCSPYAVAKVASYWNVVNYRSAYDIFCCNGILFNHESERRSQNFVTRKITRSAGLIKVGLQEKLYLGNLDAKRDWGYAKDYVEAMWLMLQEEKPDDFVISTGESHTVREFLTAVFELIDLDWHDYVSIDPYYYRPNEVDFLLGDSTKANNVLGWKPSVNFQELVRIMTEYDLELAKRDKHALKF